jgi:hypothetical protein
VDLKTPLKIMNENGEIKKILIQQESTWPASLTFPLYFRYPLVPKIAGMTPATVEFNFKVGTKLNNLIYSLFKVNLLIEDENTICNIENTHNYAKILIDTKNLVYVIEETEQQLNYLKLKFSNINTAVSITYIDVSSNGIIPDNLPLGEMITSWVPNEETVPSTINIINTSIFNARNLNSSGNIYVLTTSAMPPSASHPHIYSGTTPASWSYIQISGISTLYIWKYTGT